MEPPRYERRLTRVRRVMLPLVFISVMVFSAIPAMGQQAQESDAQGQAPIRLSASAGLAGFVDARRPVELSVTIAADVLFAGTLEIRQGEAILQLPVEVPAAGEKTYQVRVPPPVGSVQTRIRLFEGDSETPTATANLQLKAPQGQTVVAVVGPAELVATIGEATVGITNSEVVAALVEEAALENGLSPAQYLVMDGSRELPTATRDWVRQGGRVVVEPAGLANLGLDLGSAAADGEQAVYQVGHGRVIAVSSLLELNPPGWSEILGPTPVVLAPRDVWQSPDQQLMTAATSGGDQRIPGLPWLFGAVVGYAVLVGPVNFLILKKVGRRELAWLTVPILSVLAVAGFWMAGRQRLQNTLVNHATFIVASDVNPTARSAIAIAAGNGGKKEVTVPEDWMAYPGATSPDMGGGMPVAAALARTDGQGNFQFTLPQLGAAGVHGWWRPDLNLPVVSTTTNDRELVVMVNNTSDLEFWAWGVMARGRATASPAALSPGSSDEARLIPGNGTMEFGSVGDVVINSRQLWDDPFIWSRIGSLSYGASIGLDQYDTYFFGFTTELTLPIDIDGTRREVTGESLVVIPIDLAQTGLGKMSSATARLLDTGDASWIDWGPGYLSVSSQEITIGWDLQDRPGGNPSLQVTNMFGEIPKRLDLYNWTTSSYDEVNPSDVIDMSLYRSLLGEVVLRARATDENDDNQFMEFPMTPYAFTLEWGS